MDDVAAGLARRADRPGPPVGGAEQGSAVRRLAAAARVEHGPVEDDDRTGVPVGDDVDARLDRPGVGIRVAELLADVHGSSRPPGCPRAAYWTVRVPIIVDGWTSQ